jgi:hypothetical protein
MVRDFLRRCYGNIRRKTIDQPDELAWDGAALVALLVLLLSDQRVRNAVADQ